MSAPIEVAVVKQSEFSLANHEVVLRVGERMTVRGGFLPGAWKIQECRYPEINGFFIGVDEVRVLSPLELLAEQAE